MAAYVPDLSAEQVHQHLQESLVDLRRAEQNAVLWFAEIHQRRLYRELGFSSMRQYALEKLKFSKSKFYYFQDMARSFEELPAVKSAVQNGEIEWTKLRELRKVATPQNEAKWVEEAKRSSRRQLEQKVKHVRSRAKRQWREDISGQLALGDSAKQRPAAEIPAELRLRLTSVQLARFEKLMEKLRKQGKRESKEELLLASLERLVSSDVEAGKSTRVESGHSKYQVHVYKCESCDQAHVPTMRGDKPVSGARLGAILCDARIRRPGERNTSSIPPGLRAKALARDGHRCKGPGCGSTCFLEVHHIVPREFGGRNVLENLITLCSACHDVLHERAAESLVGTVRAML